MKIHLSGNTFHVYNKSHKIKIIDHVDFCVSQWTITFWDSFIKPRWAKQQYVLITSEYHTMYRWSTMFWSKTGLVGPLIRSIFCGKIARTLQRECSFSTKNRKYISKENKLLMSGQIKSVKSLIQLEYRQSNRVHSYKKSMYFHELFGYQRYRSLPLI